MGSRFLRYDGQSYGWINLVDTQLTLPFLSQLQPFRFRQEYRLERKLLAELDVDPETHPVDQEELSALFENSSQTTADRHRISRVVVLHNDKLETFLNPEKDVSKETPQGDDFFDSDSFWSGSITWF